RPGRRRRSALVCDLRTHLQPSLRGCPRCRAWKTGTAHALPTAGLKLPRQRCDLCLAVSSWSSHNLVLLLIEKSYGAGVEAVITADYLYTTGIDLGFENRCG